LPIRTDKPVHSGKVRSVYWLTPADSARLIREKGYDVPADTPPALMVISDRISAFDCIWQGVDGLNGVPGKGAALNAISSHWFKLFKEQGLADSHILDITPSSGSCKSPSVMIEAIARQYITGSMWPTRMVSARIAASPCRKDSRRIRSCPRSSSPVHQRGSSRAG
jgi:phosphoribosylaminoimidazole-succinocarboxamide synthase